MCRVFVYLPREFRDLGGEDQVLRVLRALVREKRLVRLGYGVYVAGQGILRPEIQIETAVWPLRLQPVERPVISFVAEAFKFNHPPEVPSIPCVALAETVAEKFIVVLRNRAVQADPFRRPISLRPCRPVPFCPTSVSYEGRM